MGEGGANLRVLFWNTYKNSNINSILSELIIQNTVSIVVLAEYEANMDDLIAELAKHNVIMKPYKNCSERIKMLGSHKNVDLRIDSSHHTIQIIDQKYILCGVHLNSKLHDEHEGSREIYMEQIIHDIEEVEQELGKENTIIVGDFNINPYEPSCIDARFFHGIPVLAEAARQTRIVAGKEFKMFYNPMWSLLGDNSQPYGTYYSNSGGVHNTYWNIFDQVIVRPTLGDKFLRESLKILTETETRFLLDTSGHPDKKISDHLPIIFEIMEDSLDE